MNHDKIKNNLKYFCLGMSSVSSSSLVCTSSESSKDTGNFSSSSSNCCRNSDTISLCFLDFSWFFMLWRPDCYCRLFWANIVIFTYKLITGPFSSTTKHGNLCTDNVFTGKTTLTLFEVKNSLKWGFKLLKTNISTPIFPSCKYLRFLGL